mmetsp:Transcript_13415/g.27574  ORF Transcript_13415/g.27574 Transcript_13415/m.27574 type:complete len:93 (-) Transcript_13415:51-329(-)
MEGLVGLPQGKRRQPGDDEEGEDEEGEDEDDEGARQGRGRRRGRFLKRPRRGNLQPQAKGQEGAVEQEKAKGERDKSPSPSAVSVDYQASEL